jgi:hypothetical protein
MNVVHTVEVRELRTDKTSTRKWVWIAYEADSRGKGEVRSAGSSSSLGYALRDALMPALVDRPATTRVEAISGDLHIRHLLERVEVDQPVDTLTRILQLTGERLQAELENFRGRKESEVPKHVFRYPSPEKPAKYDEFRRVCASVVGRAFAGVIRTPESFFVEVETSPGPLARQRFDFTEPIGFGSDAMDRTPIGQKRVRITLEIVE